MNKIKTIDMEIALARYFNPRINIIIPNVSWGISGHNNEIDLMIITKSDCVYEIEIKTSLSDLKKDKDKWHAHSLEMLSRLYFAIPDYLQTHIEYIPERAGILIVKNKKHECRYGLLKNNDVIKFRESEKLSNTKITSLQREKFLRLSAMRIWPLKTKISQLL